MHLQLHGNKLQVELHLMPIALTVLRWPARGVIYSGSINILGWSRITSYGWPKPKVCYGSYAHTPPRWTAWSSFFSEAFGKQLFFESHL